MLLLSLVVFSLTFPPIWTQVDFVCKSGHILTGIEKICNGREDCYDGSDEAAELCSHTFCPLGYFKCNYGACVHRSKKCNGISDCADASDEANCGRKWSSCAPTDFNCGDLGEDDGRYCIHASKLCDGNRDCKNGADENKTLCENALCPENSFRCTYGGCISEAVLCDGFYDCLDASDEVQELCFNLKCPKCTNLISCPSLVEPTIQSNRVRFKCSWNGREIPCTQRILPGTKVTYGCKDRFVPESLNDFSNDWNLCQPNGKWLRDVLKCVPDCGKQTSIIPLIANGWNSPTTLPWHASLFFVASRQRPKLLCGATLIAEAVVITAAHCVWKMKPEDLIAGLGILESDYEDSVEFNGRFYQAHNIFIHPSYMDQLGNYGSDLALVELAESVEISDYIMPVCLNWNMNDIAVHDELVGIIVGFGLTENATTSENLRVAKMPIVSTEKCLAHQTADFRKYLTFTTFCAGWGNGTNACNGDSGAGFVIRQDDGHYLEGIVSVSAREKSTDHCDFHQYTIFTKVGLYVKWIEKHLKAINSRPNALRPHEESDDG